MSDQFEKVQNEVWDALVALARTMPLDPALKDAHSSLRESGHGETLLASIASKIEIEPGRAEPEPGSLDAFAAAKPESDQAPVTAEVAKSVEKIGKFIAQPSIEKVLSQLPDELTERIGYEEAENLVRRIAARESAKIAAASTVPHDER